MGMIPVLYDTVAVNNACKYAVHPRCHDQRNILFAYVEVHAKVKR